MNRVVLLGCLTLMLLATSAWALNEFETDPAFDKDLYFEAVDAYQAGASMTPEMRAILNEYGLPAQQTPSLRRIGGPDGLGYTFVDSEEDDGPTYNWIDITDEGVDVAPQLSDDSYTGPFDIGFTFPFYGSSYTQFWVQSNGTINFQDQYISLSNYELPYTGYDSMIAWYWDDLDPNSGASGQAFYLSTTVDNENALVVSYIEYDEYPDGPDAPNVTAQVILFESGKIRLQYEDFQGAFDYAGGTIGIQSNAGLAGLSYLYNGNVPGTPYPGLAVDFEQTVQPTASVTGTVIDQAGSPVNGATVNIGAFQAMTDNNGEYDMTGVFPGTFDWNVTAPNHMPASGTVTINDGPNTVDLELTGALSTVSGTISTTNGSPLQGATVTVNGQMTTTGVDGTYSLGMFFPVTVDYSVTANGYYSISGQMTLVDGDNTLDAALDVNEPQGDILVFDGDTTPGSAQAIVPLLEDAGYEVYYTTTWNDDDWSAGYVAAFAFMGIYPNDYHFTSGDPEEAAMMAYLNGGGKLYMEGGDIFGFIAPTNLVPMFGLTATDGGADLMNVMGVPDTYTDGVNMTYNGENNFMDELTPNQPDAYTVLTNPADNMGHMVFYSTDTYATVAAGFELGMLVDQADEPNTTAYLVDGILQHLDLANPSPVELNLYGQMTVVPPSGGNIVYDVQLVSQLPNVIPGLTFWTAVALPNGQMFGPILQVPFTHTPFMNVFVTGMTQAVPAMAPGGLYTFFGNAGLYGSQLFVADDFEFEKIGAAMAGQGSMEWVPGTAPNFAGESEAALSALPVDYAMEAAYPNPFNPSTAIRVSLPEAAELTVTVHNTLGQTVATLTTGMITAGAHDFVLDGSRLASGVYLVRATVTGQLDASQKVVLMK